MAEAGVAVWARPGGHWAVGARRPVPSWAGCLSNWEDGEKEDRSAIKWGLVWSAYKRCAPYMFYKKKFLGRQISRQVWSSYHILHSDLGLVGHERRASQRALYESSIISGVRIDDYSKMRMGLTVGYTSSIRECALLIGVSCPLKKDDVKEMDNYWPRLALAGTSGNLLTRTTILISFL